ncbi:MAG TPA: hypothetical protein PKD85_02205 [Saprospiraceae bacterium]|nr:hypothetical protein [Saprospiraceae bacterium]
MDKKDEEEYKAWAFQLIYTLDVETIKYNNSVSAYFIVQKCVFCNLHPKQYYDIVGVLKLKAYMPKGDVKVEWVCCKECYPKMVNLPFL